MKALKKVKQGLNKGFAFCCSKKSLTLVAAFALACTFHNVSAQAAPNNAQVPHFDINTFIDESVQKHGLDRAAVKQILSKARVNQQVLDAIARPWEAKPWYKYYPIFLTEKRLDRGLAFWQDNWDTLMRAEREYGVPAEIIVAIIGVETFYGSYKGKYSVLDALYSLGFYYPPRSTFFRSELGQYLKLIQEEDWQPELVKGSYAGAMGWGQFISSSYRHYAVDFDGDGKRDLLNNPVDAIGSVANYFKSHHWKADEPVAFKLDSLPDAANEYSSKELKITSTWQQLAEAGIKKPKHIEVDSDTKAKVFPFQQDNYTEHWVAFDNFYSITRYNHSPLYAMVVFQFSEQLRNGFTQ